jgi:hypothetical protein
LCKTAQCRDSELAYSKGVSTIEQFKNHKVEVLQHLDKYEDFIACPECETNTLIAFGDFKGICVNEECKTCHPIGGCFRCGQPAVGFDWEEPLLDDCRAYLDHVMSKDD